MCFGISSILTDDTQYADEQHRVIADFVDAHNIDDINELHPYNVVEYRYNEHTGSDGDMSGVQCTTKRL